MSYQDILPNELETLYQHENVTIFDTREASYFTQGHLDNAIPISDQAIKQLIIRKQRHNPVLVYCYHGNSSRDICTLLNGMGFSEVYNLEGGWRAWQDFINQSPIRVIEGL